MSVCPTRLRWPLSPFQSANCDKELEWTGASVSASHALTLTLKQPYASTQTGRDERKQERVWAKLQRKDKCLNFPLLRKKTTQEVRLSHLPLVPPSLNALSSCLATFYRPGAEARVIESEDMQHLVAILMRAYNTRFSGTTHLLFTHVSSWFLLVKQLY